jgi:hypothetical protein
VLRDVYVRGKYRDVILPMTVIRRLDAVLEPTNDRVLAMKKQLDAAAIVNQDAALRQAAGQAFYNASPFTLRDTEQIPLLEEGGVEAFFRREVLPYAPDAWIDESKTRKGYEISFTRYFYQPPQLRTLDEIRADVLALEQATDGLLDEILGG